MAFIGIPFYVCAAQMCDLQARFVLTHWKGRQVLPPQNEMLTDTKRKMEQRFAKGIKKRQAHMMGEDQVISVRLCHLFLNLNCLILTSFGATDSLLQRLGGDSAYREYQTSNDGLAQRKQ